MSCDILHRGIDIFSMSKNLCCASYIAQVSEKPWKGSLLTALPMFRPSVPDRLLQSSNFLSIELIHIPISSGGHSLHCSETVP